MGASSSSDKAAIATAAAELERQKAALDAERRRLQQVALEQQWAHTRMLEEQRQKEAVEKWRREQKMKADLELQRKMAEAKMQQRLQAEEQSRREAVEKSRREEQMKADLELQRKIAEVKAQQRLQAEEQSRKEAIEKSWREEQMKAEIKLQRRLEEVRMRERLREKEQKIFQQKQPSGPPTGETWSSTGVRKTVPVHQTVPSSSSSSSRGFMRLGQVPEMVPPYCPDGKPDDAPYPVTGAPPIRPAVPSKSQASADTNKVTAYEQKTQKQADKKNLFKNDVTIMDAASTKQYKEWSIADYVAEENALNKSTANNVMRLLDQDKTVSFIARYRRAMTQGMEEDELRKVKNSYELAKQIKQRAASMAKAMEEQEERSPGLRAFINESKSLRDLDRVDSIFKVTETEDVALGIMAKEFLAGSVITFPPIEGRRTEATIINGVHLLSELMKKDIRVFEIIKELGSKCDTGVETKFAVTNGPVKLQRELQRQKYLRYDNFVSSDKLIANTDVFNIRRGESEKVLTVKINVSPGFSHAFKNRCLKLHIAAINKSKKHKELISAAVDYLYDAWARPSIEKWTREEIYEKAEIATMGTIVQHVKRLLLAPILRDKVVIGVFSLSQWVCKVAAVSERGDYLESETICPHSDKNGDAMDAETKLVRIVKKYKCTTLAVGNGAASKENKKFILGLMKKKLFLPSEVNVTVVDEAGLLQQFHNCRNEDTSEFLKSAAVSIARRLQDPMSEFVKVEPKYLVGKSHQGVPEKHLTATLNDVIVEAVSSVGVDLNTASVDLLRRVAGLDEAKAKSIVERRESFGPFTNRKDLLTVEGIEAKTFEQCAGFVRLVPETAVGKNGQRASRDSFNYLDQTSIHPKSYDVADALMNAAKCNIDQLGSKAFIFAIRIFADQGSMILAKKFGTSKAVIDLIVNALTVERPPIVKAVTNLDDDVNAKSWSAGMLNGKLSFDDLTTETVLNGVVCEIKPFGVFVAVGMKKAGLIHKKKMNGMTLSLGQRVETIVDKIDTERRVFSLRLLKCT